METSVVQFGRSKYVWHLVVICAMAGGLVSPASFGAAGPQQQQQQLQQLQQQVEQQQ